MNTSSVAYKSVATPDFMTALVHEVRNPLTNINLSLVMLKSPLGEIDQKGYLDVITRSTIRINHIINQLLLYQDIEEVIPQNQSAHLLVDTVLALVADRVDLKKAVVVKNYAPNDGKLYIDTPKIIIALTNIVINAINAMAYGKGELHVITKTEKNNFVLQIKDNGCGISKANLKHIFKPNFSTTASGLGLGLTVASHILKANNTKINVTSTLGEGTCFTLLFKSMSVVK